MKCERCGKHPSEMRYTEIREGKARKLEICGECARALGFDIESTPPPGPSEDVPNPSGAGTIVGTVSITAQISPVERSPLDPVRCPGCGMSGVDLRTHSLFGCPRCWEAFDAVLDPVLRRLHGAVRHRGRLPHGVTAAPPDVDRLRRDLADAIRDEDFDRAARVRDRLRRVRPSPEDPEEPR